MAELSAAMSWIGAMVEEGEIGGGGEYHITLW